MVATKEITSPLIVIVGETASGKSSLALYLAKKFNGEVISADSRNIYRDMSIGTAKPSLSDRQAVTHHLIDVADPAYPINVYEFKSLALGSIESISRRGKLPILVGGTGLYVDSLLYDFQFKAPADMVEREHLQHLSVEELQTKLINMGISLPVNYKNPRHLIRKIETRGEKDQKSMLRSNTLLIGLRIDRKTLEKRIESRVTNMLNEGLEDEVKYLMNKYNWDSIAFKTPGYQAIRNFIEGKSTKDEAIKEFVKSDLKLAKRQRTWFQRNKSIHWVNKQIEAVDLVTTFLNK